MVNHLNHLKPSLGRRHCCSDRSQATHYYWQAPHVRDRVRYASPPSPVYGRIFGVVAFCFSPHKSNAERLISLQIDRRNSGPVSSLAPFTGQLPLSVLNGRMRCGGGGGDPPRVDGHRGAGTRCDFLTTALTESESKQPLTPNQTHLPSVARAGHADNLFEYTCMRKKTHTQTYIGRLSVGVEHICTHTHAAHTKRSNP